MRYLALVMVLCLLGCERRPTDSSQAPPNIVLIISDDHGWTDFGFMGHDVIETPHLDALAAESMLYTRGYVPTSVCRPSLATMITGLFPHEHGITGNDPPGGLEAMRDPVRRAWSHYLHQCRNARETLSFEDALAREDSRLEDDPESWLGYYRDGLYSQQLKAWFGAFGRDKFLIRKQSQLAADPQETVDAVYRFLGVPPRELDDVSARNKSSVPRSRWLMRVMSANFPGREWLKSVMPPDWRRGLLVWIRRRNTRELAKDEVPTLDPATEHRLRQRYASEIDNLETLLGESFDEWKTGAEPRAS